MTIAAFISKTNPADQALWECLDRISRKFPDHHFIIFSEHPDLENKNSNITPVLIQPSIRNGLLLHYWSQYKLPYLLKRYQADIFISENSAVGLRIKIPQILLISNPALASEVIPEDFPLRKYMNKLLPYFIRKASKIASTEEIILERLVKKFNLSPAKTIDLSFGVGGRQTSWSDKEKIINRVSDGRDYFLFIYDKSTAAFAIEVLKAFSIFKKWQKSSMQMIIISSGDDIISIKDLALYKYREDVRLIQPGGSYDFAEIISASFAVIQLNETRTAYDAMHMGIPVICSDTGFNKHRFENTVLYTIPKQQPLSEQMMRLYKDENLRDDLIKTGLESVALKDWDKTSLRLWETIVEQAEP